VVRGGTRGKIVVVVNFEVEFSLQFVKRVCVNVSTCLSSIY
jgi:hypothetical protein